MLYTKLVLMALFWSGVFPAVSIVLKSVCAPTACRGPRRARRCWCSASDSSASRWTALGYLIVFGTVPPFLWFYEGVKALGAARAAQFINLVLPLAVAESVLILGEPMTPALYVGAAFVVAGLYLTNRPR